VDLKVQVKRLRFGHLAGNGANKPEKDRLIERKQKDEDAEKID
jgi:hypothetical protein